MRLRAKVGSKGQAVIPKEIRSLLGIRPGDEVVLEVRDEGFVVKPASRGSSVTELAELVPKEAKLRKGTDIKKLILSEVAERWST